MSLQVCVPGGCPNKCAFCVSRMHDNAYPNRTDEFEREYIKRMQYARESNYSTVVLTGTGEPLSNPDFIRCFGTYNAMLATPFRWIETQTSGVGLIERFSLLKSSGVSTISLSLASIFDSDVNAKIVGMPTKMVFDTSELCQKIKSQGFNLRLSLNMWSTYNGVPPQIFFKMARSLGADQITFKMLHTSEEESPQAEWVREHEYKEMSSLTDWIKATGLELEMLSFGAVRYDVEGISTVVDNESCLGLMGPEHAKKIRYLILRPDCRLYTRWDSKGSLLF